ncbi:sensor histidine kinase [Bacteroidota bacterium]
MAHHIYTKKQRWKFFFFIVAILIGVASVLFTNQLVKVLREEEDKKIDIWAQAFRGLDDELPAESDTESDPFFLEITEKFYLITSQIIGSNNTIPTIHVEKSGKIISYRNIRRLPKKDIGLIPIDSLSEKEYNYLKKQLRIMKEKKPAITINLDSGDQYLYYKHSFLLTQLKYFPFIQFAIVLLFIIVSYFAFNSSNKAEQNQVWVGLSKETAHQLGTPISSLLAWVELLKGSKHNLVPEIEKDVQRLEKITERFSKIGATPLLTKVNIVGVLENSVEYLRTRSSDKIKFIHNYPKDLELYVPLNVSLFEWVIENICKNSIDAMDGSGEIVISLTDHNQVIFLDIQDSGKGISKSYFKAVFQPGYTTKQRGWGLGLSLSNRIVENYHSGKIFVKRSEINVGTTFRIVLKK